MADDNELIKEKGKSMDDGAVRQKKGSYSSKKKALAGKFTDKSFEHRREGTGRKSTMDILKKHQ
jgi:hypothetical protein